MPKVSDEHKQAVQARLLDAAEACLIRIGLEKTTIRDILNEAGLSAGALYTYFGSKDDLFVALAEREQSTTMEDALGELDPDEVESALDVLLWLLLRTLHPNVDNPLVRQLRHRAIHDEAIAQSMLRYDEHNVNVNAPFVDEGKNQGILDSSHDTAALIELISVIYEGLETRVAGAGFVSPVSSIVETTQNILLFGLAPEDATLRNEIRASLAEKRRKSEEQLPPWLDESGDHKKLLG